jgi:hypothetical protein
MRQREFIVGLGAPAWPAASRAQQSAVPVVGFLKGGSAVSARSAMLPMPKTATIHDFLEFVANSNILQGKGDPS